MKNLIKSILKANKALFAGVFSLSLVLTSAFGLVDTAFAATPSLSVVNNSANVVQITVNGGDANSTINLYYNFSSSSNVYVANLGTTNSSGYFSTNLNQNSYSIPQNAYVYVIVNGQTSNTVLWPNNVNNYGSVTLSQNSLTLGYSQSTNVSIYGGNGGYYISSNSNSSIVSASINGSTLNLTSYNTAGNSALTVCSYNNNGCATLYVYVQSNSNYNQPTYLSQSSININVGQGQSISISGSGSYTISSNSNPTAISSLVNGSVLNVYGSAPGSGTLNVCSTSGNGGCASLYVTVGGYTYYNNNNTGYTTYNNGSYYNGYPYGYTYSNQGRVLGASTDSSSVYLSQVPSTGISLNLKVVLFMVGLLSWSLFATYILMAKQKKFVSR
jgi:hypothetical protein